MSRGDKPDRFLSAALAVCCLAILCALALPGAAETVNFPDPGLEQAIRDAIGKPTGDIHDSDLVGLTDLTANNKSISNLEGLQHCTDLVTLRLAGNNIHSVLPLAGLVNLVELYLNDNVISDISSLAALTNLVELGAMDNNIADVSVLAAMTGLTDVNLGDNSVSDITPLAGLTNLIFLKLNGCEIADISPLAGLTGLRGLTLGGRTITDFSVLTGLVNLEGLELQFCGLYDLEPLILNVGLGAGDIIYIRYNHLCLSPGSHDQLDVDALVARGATVYSDPQLFCPDSAATFRVFITGDVEIDKTLRAQAFEAGAADVAEWVRVSEPVTPGDVVALDTDNTSTYRLSRQPCSPLVAGVISTEPGVVLGRAEAFDQRALLALAGIVPVKVTDEGGPIRSGDLLVAASTPGYAMRWPSLAPCSCVLIGKALEPMRDETGVILVLLTAH